MLHRRICLACLAAMILLLNDAKCQVPFPEVKQKLKESYDRNLPRYRFVQYQSEHRLCDALRNEKLLSHHQRKLKTSNAGLIQETIVEFTPDRSAGENPFSKTIGYNSQYAFWLEQSPKKADWRLVQAKADSDAETDGVLSRAIALAKVRHLMIHQYAGLNGVPLTETFQSKFFQLDSCAAQSGNPKLINVVFHSDMGEGANKRIHQVSAVLDSSMGWVERGWSEVITFRGSTSEVRSKYEFQLLDGDLPVLASSKAVYFTKRDGVIVKHHVGTTEYTASFRKDLPESELTLSAYGLPEPVGVNWIKPTPRYVWWLLALGCCASVAVVCRLIARRMRRMSTRHWLKFREFPMRYLVSFTLLAAGICLLMAGYDYFFVPPATPPPPFEIGQTEFSVGEVPLGTHKLRTTIGNPSTEPRRILGIAGECAGNSCFTSTLETPVQLPPVGSLELECELEVKAAGPIAAEFKIYLEENGIRTVTLRVTGTAVEAPRAPK